MIKTHELIRLFHKQLENYNIFISFEEKWVFSNEHSIKILEICI